MSVFLTPVRGYYTSIRYSLQVIFLVSEVLSSRSRHDDDANALMMLVDLFRQHVRTSAHTHTHTRTLHPPRGAGWRSAED